MGNDLENCHRAPLIALVACVLALVLAYMSGAHPPASGPSPVAQRAQR